MNESTAARPTFAGDARIHVSLNVADLARSIDFYRILFGTEPTKERGDYAKFEPETPKLHLSLLASQGATSGPGNLSHLGVQVNGSEAVRAAAERLARGGLKGRVEEAVTCCYAVQDKLWISDPDGNEWEVFTTLADVPGAQPETGTACCQ